MTGNTLAYAMRLSIAPDETYYVPVRRDVRASYFVDGSHYYIPFREVGRIVNAQKVTNISPNEMNNGLRNRILQAFKQQNPQMARHLTNG